MNIKINLEFSPNKSNVSILFSEINPIKINNFSPNLDNAKITLFEEIIKLISIIPE
jgi:hypothetical protein